MDGGDGDLHRLQTMLGEELVEPFLRRPGRRHLGQDVALAFVRAAYVREHHVEFLAVRALGCEQPERGNAEPFLPGVGGIGHVAARHGAADVGPMGEAHGKGTDGALGKHRPDRLDVGQMVAAHLGQIEEPHVTGRQAAFGHAFQEFLHREAHDAHVHGDVPALGNQFPVGVGERRGQVARLAQQGRTGRAHDDQRHLLGRRRQRIADDLEGHRIDRPGLGGGHGASPASMCRLPDASRVSAAPGGTTTVDQASSTMVGPSMGTPSGKAARSKRGVATPPPVGK